LFLHEAEIFAKASNCFRTEATALLDSFFLAVLLLLEVAGLTASEGLLRGAKERRTSLLSGVVAAPLGGATHVTVLTGVILVGVVRAESGVLGEDCDEKRLLPVPRGVRGSGLGDEEQLKISSPYLAMRSARLKSGLAGVFDEDLKEGGELFSDEDERSESFDSLSELLKRVKLLLRAGVVPNALLAPNAGLFAFLNMW